jgi:hypothetical protein
MVEPVSVVANVTSGISFNNLGSGFGWTITGITFCFIFLLIFIISKNFRRTIIGSIITGIILIVYKISRWFGISTEKGNYVPIKWFIYITIFIVLSWLFGILLEKNKRINKIIKSLHNEEKKE